MPRDVALHIPFHPRISEDAPRAERHQLNWPKAHGLIPTEASIERHLRARCAEVAARCHPTARGGDLDLGVDQMNWFFLFDDLFDGERGRDVQRAAALVESVVKALNDQPPVPTPIARAFADLWRRSRQGMSEAWQARTVTNWQSYFLSFLGEAAQRRHPPSSVEEYMKVRRISVGVRPILDLAERLHHRELPTIVLGSSWLTAMRDITVDVPLLNNEIFSLEKEEARGDQNLVLLLERLCDWPRPRAIAKIQDMARARIEQFLALEAGLPSLLDPTMLSASERDTVHLYVQDTLRPVMRGIYDWHFNAGRYTASYVTPSDQPGYLVDLG